MKGRSAMETVAQVLAPDVSYDRRTIQLHWVTAALVGLLWAIAEVIDFFPKGAPKIAVRSVHIALGVVLGVILLTRIAWRSRSARRLPRASDGVLGHAAIGADNSRNRRHTGSPPFLAAARNGANFSVMMKCSLGWMAL